MLDQENALQTGFKTKSNNYFELVIDQGAEYATMGDIIFKYENPIIIGADHLG